MNQRQKARMLAKRDRMKRNEESKVSGIACKEFKRFTTSRGEAIEERGTG